MKAHVTLDIRMVDLVFVLHVARIWLIDHSITLIQDMANIASCYMFLIWLILDSVTFVAYMVDYPQYYT